MAGRIWRFCCSLQLAVMVILGLVAALAAGTVLESVYDARTAGYYVYDSAAFATVIVLLAINIAAVMVDRWPWRLKHAPFVLAHAGILMLILGSWVTGRFGVDALLPLTEGQARDIVELDQADFVIKDGARTERISIPWIPPMKAFKPIPIAGYGLVIDRYLTHADPGTDRTYERSRAQFGPAAPPSAIRVRLGPENGQSLWIGEGGQAVLKLDDREVALSYVPRTTPLPVGLRLEKFQIDHYEGTLDPRSYSSIVRPIESGRPGTVARISMNEPLKLAGYTFYQASYIPGEPRPVTSVLSVNRDPGRSTKYAGSLLIVLGSILLFARRYGAFPGPRGRC